jgi:hypothetical protein
MGARGLIVIALAACGHPAAPHQPASLGERVVADFEAAVKQSKDAYVALFDFAAVGEFEILLHRYDLNGRLAHLEDDQKQQFISEDGTPYPAERERRNVGNFYTILAQRTVGTGGCTASEPRTRYGKLLGVAFEPLPAQSETTIAGNKVAQHGVTRRRRRPALQRRQGRPRDRLHGARQRARLRPDHDLRRLTRHSRAQVAVISHMSRCHGSRPVDLPARTVVCTQPTQTMFFW